MTKYRTGFDRPMTAAERREARRDDHDARRVTEAHSTDWAAKYAAPDAGAAAEKKLRQRMTIAEWNAYKAARKDGQA